VILEDLQILRFFGANLEELLRIDRRKVPLAGAVGRMRPVVLSTEKLPGRLRAKYHLFARSQGECDTMGRLRDLLVDISQPVIAYSPVKFRQPRGLCRLSLPGDLQWFPDAV